LGFVSLLDSLNVNIPRYLIERRLGEAALGYYAAMAYIVVAGNMVVAALTQSAAPRLARYYVTRPLAFKRLLWRLLTLGAAMGGAGVLLAVTLGRPLLALLYRPDYADTPMSVWLMARPAWYVAASDLRDDRLRHQGQPFRVARWRPRCHPGAHPRYGLAALALCAAMATLLLGAIAITLARSRAGASREDHAPAEAEAAAAERQCGPGLSPTDGGCTRS
jgi:hypothetical protein